MANKQKVQERPGRQRKQDYVDDGKAHARIVSIKDAEAAALESKYGSLTKALKSLIKK